MRDGSGTAADFGAERGGVAGSCGDEMAGRIFCAWDGGGNPCRTALSGLGLVVLTEQGLDGPAKAYVHRLRLLRNYT
jgi:hypothetical protein